MAVAVAGRYADGDEHRLRLVQRGSKVAVKADWPALTLVVTKLVQAGLVDRHAAFGEGGERLPEPVSTTASPRCRTRRSRPGDDVDTAAVDHRDAHGQGSLAWARGGKAQSWQGHTDRGVYSGLAANRRRMVNAFLRDPMKDVPPAQPTCPTASLCVFAADRWSAVHISRGHRIIATEQSVMDRKLDEFGVAVQAQCAHRMILMERHRPWCNAKPTRNRFH